MKPVVVFDVNETLLDLSPVRDWFGVTFGESEAAGRWFQELLRLSFVSSVTDQYSPFTDLAIAALRTTIGHEPRERAIAEIKGALTTLPPHPDVATGITELVEAGYTIAALTNSPLATAHTQLANAGISGSFDEIMSVEMVRRFKPHRSVYEAAADKLGIPINSMIMVAAHDWDIAGAMAAGCHGVFIARGGHHYSSAFTEPTLSAPDITQAARQILHRFE